MSVIKTKEFHVEGTTVELADGKTRKFTIVAVLESEEVDYVDQKQKQTEVGSKLTITTTYESLKYTEHTLSLGLAIVSPSDEAIATADAGLAIARGKALKPKSALLVLSTRFDYFNNGVIKELLKREAAKVARNPQKYVRITVKPAVSPSDVVSAADSAE